MGSRGPALRTLLLVVMLQAAAAQAAAQTRFDIEAPPELASDAARLEALLAEDLPLFRNLLGWTEPGGPVRLVMLADSDGAAERVPRWITGFTRGRDDLIVIFPERVPRYPNASLAELVRHERAHLLIDRAAGGAAVPRWFHEGLAMLAEGSWQMNDRSRLALAMLKSGEPDLGELNGLFRGTESEVAWAYAISGAYVRDLVARGEEGAVARLFSGLRRGETFESSFEDALGLPADRALESFWRRTALWYRWVPLVTSSTVLWIGISFLALLAVQRRRARARVLLERWEAEERATEPEYTDLVN